jgi:hypothetical protein
MCIPAPSKWSGLSGRGVILPPKEETDVVSSSVTTRIVTIFIGLRVATFMTNPLKERGRQ